jgi:hypothetical protein
LENPLAELASPGPVGPWGTVLNYNLLIRKFIMIHKYINIWKVNLNSPEGDMGK